MNQLPQIELVDVRLVYSLLHFFLYPNNNYKPSLLYIFVFYFAADDFSHVDRMVDWAVSKGLKVKGHVLCWHVTTPDYVEQMSGDQICEELKRHIYTTMGTLNVCLIDFQNVLFITRILNIFAI